MSRSDPTVVSLMPRFHLSRRMLAILSAVVTAALVAGLVLIVAGPATAKEFATLHPLTGTVEVRKAGAAFAPGTEGQTLRQGDTVRTGSDGRAEIEYFDGSVTRLDFDTTYELVELASLPDVPDSKVIRGEQTEGRTFHRVVAITDSESRVETDTPNAVASVRGTKYLVWIHPDGTEEYWVLEGQLLVSTEQGDFLVGAGEGLRVTGDEVEGPFPLTELQLEDAFLVFNQCELDGEEDACPTEVEPQVERRNDRRDQPPPSPPAPPDDGDDTSLFTGDESDGGDGGDPSIFDPPDPGPPPPPEPDIDSRPIRFVLSWSEGPADLDLHVQTPDDRDAEGGEVSWANPCLSGPDGCWASFSGDAREYGTETVTLRPIGDEWMNGGYPIWVENISCTDGDWADSNATLTVMKGRDELTTIAVPDTGAVRSETWQAASGGVDRVGLVAVFNVVPPFVGDESCGLPEPELELTKQPRGPADPGSAAIGVEAPPADEAPAEEPPAEEPPAEQPPSPEPSPEPEPNPEPTDPPDDLPSPDADAAADVPGETS